LYFKLRKQWAFAILYVFDVRNNFVFTNYEGSCTLNLNEVKSLSPAKETKKKYTCSVSYTANIQIQFCVIHHQHSYENKQKQTFIFKRTLILAIAM